MLFWQDIVLTVSPYPYAVGESSDIPLEKCRLVRHQLFFSCHLRPRGGRPPKRANYTYGADDIQVQLVFYSTFEPVDLPGGGPLEAVGVQKLYKPSPTPILDVGLAVLGRVRAGTRALDALVMGLVPPRQLYPDHPTLTPSAPARNVPIWAGRRS